MSAERRRLLALGVAALIAATWLLWPAPAPTHNAAGGYIDACGPELPGLVGDDC